MTNQIRKKRCDKNSDWHLQVWEALVVEGKGLAGSQSRLTAVLDLLFTTFASRAKPFLERHIGKFHDVTFNQDLRKFEDEFFRVDIFDS